MDINDLTQIIINIAQSLGSVQRLVSGMAYVLGIGFIISAIFKFHKIAGMSTKSGASESMFTPFAYLVGGAVLLFLPSSFQTLSLTVFGSNSILGYAPLKPVDVTSATIFLIRTAGLIWFVRGCVLLVSASQPGVQHGPKGMVFLCAGILAMNFEATTATINSLLEEFMSFTLSVKNHLGY